MYIMDIGKTREITDSALSVLRGPGKDKKDNKNASPEDLQSLKWQLDKLKKREAELIEREKAVKALEDDLVKREQEVELLIDENELLKKSLTSQVEDLKEVAKLYEEMEAQAAARLLEKTDNEFAAYVLKSIKKDKAAEVLGLMDVDKAAAIIEAMTSGREAT